MVSKIRIFNFSRNFAFWQLRVCWKYDIRFQTNSLKYPNKASVVWKLFLLFCTIFCISTNFRVLIPNIATIFSPILSLKIPKETFLVSNLRIFIFAQNIRKRSNQNYINKSFLVPKLKLFVLHDLPFHKSEVTDSSCKNF